MGLGKGAEDRKKSSHPIAAQRSGGRVAFLMMWRLKRAFLRTGRYDCTGPHSTRSIATSVASQGTASTSWKGKQRPNL